MHAVLSSVHVLWQLPCYPCSQFLPSFSGLRMLKCWVMRLYVRSPVIFLFTSLWKVESPTRTQIVLHLQRLTIALIKHSFHHNIHNHDATTTEIQLLSYHIPLEVETDGCKKKGNL